MTREKAKNLSIDMPQNTEAKARSLIHSSFDDRLIDKLLPGYNNPLEAIDDVSCPWVLNSCQPAWFRELGIDDWYENVSPFSHTFLILNSLQAILFLSKQAALILRDIA